MSDPIIPKGRLRRLANETTNTMALANLEICRTLVDGFRPGFIQDGLGQLDYRLQEAERTLGELRIEVELARTHAIVADEQVAA